MDVTRAGGQTGTSVPGSGVAPGEEVEVRMLDRLEEFRGCVDLQRAIWGASYVDVVPASILQVTQKVDGVAAGAVLPDGSLVGFVYGISGFRNGRPSHWSHMLGVLPEYRGCGIGRRLKLFQAHWLAEKGISEMRWTFDPLVAGNAHFNLTGLGARVDEYVPEAYGETGSHLHNFGTDRFIALWTTEDAVRAEEAPRTPEPPERPLPPVVNIPPLGEGVQAHRGEGAAVGDDGSHAWSGGRVRVQIPDGIYRISRESPELAEAWRRSTRPAFVEGIRRGFQVTAFVRGPKGGPHHYVLSRDAASGG